MRNWQMPVPGFQRPRYMPVRQAPDTAHARAIKSIDPSPPTGNASRTLSLSTSRAPSSSDITYVGADP